MRAIGSRRWAISEGRLPGWSQGAPPYRSGIDALLVLNASDEDARVAVTVFFADREPAGPYVITVRARRTAHVRFDELEYPERLPRETDFASVLESDVPVVVRHLRVESREPDAASRTAVAYASPE